MSEEIFIKLSYNANDKNRSEGTTRLKISCLFPLTSIAKMSVFISRMSDSTRCYATERDTWFHRVLCRAADTVSDTSLHVFPSKISVRLQINDLILERRETRARELARLHRL